MAQSEFSETQFVFGFLRELFDLYGPMFWSATGFPYFSLPSTVKEKDLSADFLVRHYSHSEYYQFKRSDRLQQRVGPREAAAGVPSSFRTYYRFDIYNRRTFDPTTGRPVKGQFEKLVEKAAVHSNRVYYCAPCFHTEQEYLTHFSGKKILDHSIRIDCSQFATSSFSSKFNINDGAEHCMVYRRDRAYGYICSEAIQIEVGTRIHPHIDVPQPDNFRDYLLGNYIKEMPVFTREAPTRDTIFEIIKELAGFLMSRYNILWLPLFRHPNG